MGDSFSIEHPNGVIKTWENCEDDKSWGIYTKEILGMIHTVNCIPENDKEEHDLSPECKCNPEIHLEDGVTYVVHNSFDRRELLEELEEGTLN